MRDYEITQVYTYRRVLPRHISLVITMKRNEDVTFRFGTNGI